MKSVLSYGTCRKSILHLILYKIQYLPTQLTLLHVQAVQACSYPHPCPHWQFHQPFKSLTRTLRTYG